MRRLLHRLLLPEPLTLRLHVNQSCTLIARRPLAETRRFIGTLSKEKVKRKLGDCSPAGIYGSRGDLDENINYLELPLWTARKRIN